MSAEASRGGTFVRGELGYEAARRAAAWNARLPDRYPDVIVQANDADDVVRAVRRAHREGLRVGVRSGGHSWAANHVRDGGMLLDVSRLRDVTIDEASLRATVGPGRAGHELAGMLADRGLFFPAGHCRGVCVGGYLLQGGFGWHGRTLGPACMSVVGIDYVDAEGTLRTATEDENAEMLWAARGAGPGFFGVVVRFHLRLHRRPRVVAVRFAAFAGDAWEDAFRWAHRVGPDVPPSIELMLLVSRDVPLVRGPGILVVAPVFEDDWGAARRAASFVDGRPRSARFATPLLPTKLSWLYGGVMQHYPDHHRYAVDNMWTHASIDELLPGLGRIVETLPPAPSHALWMNWAPRGERPDMAYSVEDETYLALYGVWKDPMDDGRIGPWAETRLREMAHLSSGCQLADENLARRPQRFVSDASMARLDALRAKHDGAGRFHPWMGRP